jgi:hypothetical protein
LSGREHVFLPPNPGEAEDQSRYVVGFDLPKAESFGTK